MRAAFALVLIVPCFAQVLPRQTVPGRGSGKPVPANGVIEAVQVDAVAVDSTGRLATGLGVKDFEILHDGRAQTVEKVDFIETGGRRTITLIVDDLGLTLAEMRQVRWAVSKFVDEQVKPEDRISILRTSGGAGSLQQLTSDKMLLHEAAERLQFCPWSRAEAGAEAREQALALSLGTVRHAIDYLREEPGRKAVVLISQNLRERGTSSRGMALKTAFDELMKMADVGSVVFYAIDPRGLEAQTAPPPEGKQAPVISFSSNATRGPDSGYMILARDTGGMIVENRDTAAGLGRVLGDLEGYYVITYRPDATSFAIATGDRNFENLTVKSPRQGLIVRGRNGLLPARAKVENEDPVLSLEDSWRSRAIGSPFASGEIRMRVTPIFENSARVGSVVDAVIYVDPRDLTFVQGLDGVRSTTLDVVLAAYGELGSIDAQGSSEVALRFSEASFERAIRDGLVFVLRLQVHKPGPYILTVALRDETGSRVGASGQFVEVGDVAKGDFEISGLYLQGDLVEPARVEVGGITKVASENAGIRVFRAGSKFGFGYMLFNLPADKEGRSAVEVATDILRDGVPTYTSHVQVLRFEPAVDSKRRAAIGSVTLAKESPPGSYVLRVTVTDKAAGAQTRVVRQYLDFEVR